MKVSSKKTKAKPESAKAKPARAPKMPKRLPVTLETDDDERIIVKETHNSPSQTLEAAIGSQVRALRKRHEITVVELAQQAGLSVSMLSKIENGGTSPSLGTLQALAQALNVPLTNFFAKFDEKRDATYVKSGNGLHIERRGTRSGHQYQLLGHSVHSDLTVEPYLITLTDEADPFPYFQHDGVEFIYMLSGEVGYRHADKIYVLKKGDSLFFDSGVYHGPEELRKLPMQYLSIIVFPTP
jgi:transcriptional regulator with XRE-family HTH domain